MNPEQENDLAKQLIAKTRVGTDADLKNAEYLGCGPRRYSPDQIEGNCHLCRAVVYYSPHSPKDLKRICIECLLIETKGVLPDGSCFISSETQAEVVLKFLEDLTKK